MGVSEALAQWTSSAYANRSSAAMLDERLLRRATDPRMSVGNYNVCNFVRATKSALNR